VNECIYKTQTRFLFHSHIKIKIPKEYGIDVFDALFRVMEEVDRRYNSYRVGSYFQRINQYAGHFVEVDDETVRMLKTIISFSSFFEGKYDITIMPLLRLWGFYNKEARRVPSLSELQSMRALVDYRNIEIAGNYVRIKKGQETITGSFIKAFAVDKLKEKMKVFGITHAIINAGGSTITAINNDIHRTWQINVGKLEDKERSFLLNLSNQCFSTSEQVTSQIDINGKKYGHILNPTTGYPSSNKRVGIITDSCFLGDILSTGLLNETPADFLYKTEMLSRYYKVDGFLIDDRNEMYYTPQFLSKYKTKTMSI